MKKSGKETEQIDGQIEEKENGREESKFDLNPTGLSLLLRFSLKGR